MTEEWHTLGMWICNQAGWHRGVQQRREGATERLAMGRDVTGMEEMTIVVTLTMARRILWSPLWKPDYLLEWDMLCMGCKAESRSRVLWSQGRRGIECPEARLVQAALGCRIRGETVCAVEVRGSCLVAQHLTVGGAWGCTDWGLQGHWNMLQGSGVALTSCGIWQKQIFQ